MVAPVSSPTGASAASSKSLAGFAQNFDSFLTLLTAQLKNQDPLSPLDATQFTTQLVQFTGVEQAIHQNQSLETLISLQKDTGVGSAVGYLGKTVSANGDSITLTNSAGIIVPVRLIGEQHVIEDCGRLVTPQDWLEHLTPQPWMNKPLKLSRELDERPT